MRAQDVAAVLSYLTLAYNRSPGDDPDALLAVWVDGIGDLDAAAVWQFARDHVRRSPRFPTIADVREACRPRPEHRALEPARIDPVERSRSKKIGARILAEYRKRRRDKPTPKRIEDVVAKPPPIEIDREEVERRRARVREAAERTRKEAADAE